jgi:hypothetical protein
MSRIALNTRKAKVLTTIGVGVTALAIAGTGIAAAAPAKPDAPKPAAPAAGTQNLGAYTRVVGQPATLLAGGFASSIVSCPAGQVALGGGESNTAFGTVVLTDSLPLSTTQWLVWVKSNDTVAQTFTAYVLCGV